MIDKATKLRQNKNLIIHSLLRRSQPVALHFERLEQEETGIDCTKDTF